MNNIEFKTTVKVSNGSLIRKANMNRIRVYSTRLCTDVIHRSINNKNYFEMYVVKKEKEGYIFREVTHGMGISGHHKTLRSLIISACSFPHFRVAIEQEQPVAMAA